MKNNRKGGGSGITLIILLCVALLVAYLFMTQMGSLGFGMGSSNGGDEAQEEQEGQDKVDAAKDAVDKYNDKMNQYEDYLDE